MLKPHEIVQLSYGTRELDDLRGRAVNKDLEALLEYAYFCSWQGILADKYIPPEKKFPVFKALMKADVLEVSVG